MARVLKAAAFFAIAWAAVEWLLPDAATVAPIVRRPAGGGLAPVARPSLPLATVARVKSTMQATTGGVRAVLGGAGLGSGLSAAIGTTGAAAIVGAPKVLDDELLTLARTLYGEIRIGSLAQIENVAAVIAARRADPRWPNTWSGVCLQRLQFSCWNSNDPNLPKMKAMTLNSPDADWQRCVDVALRAMAGGVPDRTGRANHYYAPRGMGGKLPSWYRSDAVTLNDGLHVFLRL